MDLGRRRLLSAVSTSTAILAVAPITEVMAAGGVKVRMWPSNEYTRVTLETDAPLKYKQIMINKPPRLVIDIQGLVITDALKKMIAAVKPNDPYIKSMRIGQFKPGVGRLVMDLKGAVRPQVFALKPFGKYKYRLVLDIYPAVPKDAVGQILADLDASNESLNGAGHSTASTDDPLGDMLNDLKNGQQSPQQKANSKRTQLAKNSKKSDSHSSKNVTNDQVVIVVDPGHGGEDPGAIGRRKTQEKDVVLQIARRLVALINKEGNMKAVMTRNSDHFVSLGGRVAIARKVRAHLLISIHADAWVNSTVRGSSVFALSEHGATSAAARWLAKNQNESDLIGGTNLSSVNKNVASVIVDMTSKWTIGYSLGLGSAVLQELRAINKLHKTHVEQAGFAVLKGQGIPSILVETAFISNPNEERLLTNATHQQKIAQAILLGVKKQLAADSTLIQT